MIDIKRPGDFDEEAYLRENPDVAEYVRNNPEINGWEHFARFGYLENRRGVPPRFFDYVRHCNRKPPNMTDEETYEQLAEIIRDVLMDIISVSEDVGDATLQQRLINFFSQQRLVGFFSTLPFRFQPDGVAPPEHVSHSAWGNYLSSEYNRKGVRILEIGSRKVTGANIRNFFPEAEYVGFDFYPGEYVDVVGDAHHLRRYFSEEDRFDLILSSAVFEHLYMPWVVAVEIQKMLKVGGCVFIETHFSFSSHERPWHFFQFSDMGLRALFNDALGFDLVDSGMSNPISGYFAPGADSVLRYLPVPELYCHSEILCRKRCEIDAFEWSTVSIDQVVGETRYPKPSTCPSPAPASPHPTTPPTRTAARSPRRRP